MSLPGPFNRRILTNVLVDGALAALAAPVASFVAAPSAGLLRPLWFLAGGASALLVAGIPFQMSRQYWRFAGIADLFGVVGGSVASALLFAAVLTEAGFPLPTPTFPIVHALVLIVFLGAPRILYRLRRGRARTDARPVLLAGGGEGTAVFLRAQNAGGGGPRYQAVGILTRDPTQVGTRINGAPILGSLLDAGPVLTRLRTDDRLPHALVVTDPAIDGSALAALLAAADDAGVPVRRAPRPTALQSAPAGEITLAPVAIEDLLNRPQVPLDRDGMARLVRGRRVLVTGAGGTIGSELARQVAGLGPSHLVLLDNGEYALWQIDVELAETRPEVPREARIADIRDEPRMRAVCEEIRPELVFHAAALKHVPMVEANPAEGLQTNAVGTRVVADAARAAGAAAFVLISSDKAVNPSSVMGASKRLAEMYMQGLDVAARRTGGMRGITVRFGNVLGSTGSVVPLFRRQLEHGGPLTVTHPEMQRYFMTVREAVGLVLQAAVVDLADDTSEGVPAGIFVLDMGDPVRIVDLARQMIRLAGLRVLDDGAAAAPGAVAIRFTGLRPGEKLFEELFHGAEAPVPTGHPGLLMADPRTADPAIVGRAIDEIAGLCRAGHVGAALATLGRLVPEFEHNPTGAVRAIPGAAR